MGPGYYALIGHFSVLGPASFQLDVEAMEQVPDPNLPEPPRQLAAPCYPDERVAPLRGWSQHFRVEQGGIVLLVKSDAASEIGQLSVSYGLKGVEMETCDGVLALWMPGLDCPPHGGLMDAIGKVGRVLRTVCFRPLSVEDVKQRCKRGAIPSSRCN